MAAPGAVVIGGYANGLGVARSLAARGIRVAVVNTRSYDIAHHSRAVSESCVAHDFHRQPEVLLDLLEHHAPRWRGWALFPTNDHALEVVSRHHERLSRSYRLTSPPWEVICRLLHKDCTHQIAQGLGIDVPYVYGHASADTAARPDIRYPVVVKPTQGHLFVERFNRKMFVANSHEQLAAHCLTVEQAGIDALVVDLVPGSDHRVYTDAVYVDSGGDLLAGLTVRKVRQNPPFFGVSRVAEIAETPPGMREATLAIMRKVGYRGWGAAQYKLDPRDGRLRLLEVNGRAVLSNRLAHRAGINFPFLVWSDYVLDEPVRATANGWQGVWIHLYADVLFSLLFHRVERLTLSQLLAPYAKPKTFAVWSARDPMPFLAQWAHAARQGVRLLGRRDELRTVMDRVEHSEVTQRLVEPTPVQPSRAPHPTPLRSPRPLPAAEARLPRR